jgi:2-dehydropantoate 2-reductase
MEESQAIATALNVRIRLSIEQRIAGAEEVGEHKTSMFQDLDAGQPMEIDSLIGVFMELGILTNVPTPLIDALHALISLLDSHSTPQVATRTIK